MLNELEFGSWKTLDLHLGFLKPRHSMYDDYKILEFCLIGSQTLDLFRFIPIRYLKEDSSDNTVRTSACNLNFNYIQIKPHKDAFDLSISELNEIIETRLNNDLVDDHYYHFDLKHLSQKRRQVPFAIMFETAHFDDDIGIVAGKDNRKSVLPLVYAALDTPFDEESYQQTADVFEAAKSKTFNDAKKLDSNLFEWDKHSQYEGHAQLIFRIVDQFGEAVEYFDITFKSTPKNKKQTQLEKMIEDRHKNKIDKGTITFYLRTQTFNKKNKVWVDLLDKPAELNIEISGHEPLSGDIAYLPLNIVLTSKELKQVVKSFQTTIIDVELIRLPSENVFKV